VAPEEDRDSEAVAVVVPTVRLVVGAAGCDQGLVDHAARDHRRAEVARRAGLGDSHVADDVAVTAHDVLLSAPAAVGDHAMHDALGPGASSLTTLLASLLGLLLTTLVVTLLGLLGALVDGLLVGLQVFEDFLQVLANSLFSEVVLGVQLFEQVLQVGYLGVLDTGPFGHDLDPILINLVRGFAGQVVVSRLGLVGDLVAIGVLVLDFRLLDGL